MTFPLFRSTTANGNETPRLLSSSAVSTYARISAALVTGVGIQRHSSGSSPTAGSAGTCSSVSGSSRTNRPASVMGSSLISSIVMTVRRPALPRALLLAAAPLRAQCPDGTPPPCRSSRVAAPVPAANSVAVLYFENASRDTADQYLADGITEEITTSLGRIGRLQVVSPAAVRRAQQSGGGDPARLARALGVRHLVQGSVPRAGAPAPI